MDKARNVYKIVSNYCCQGELQRVLTRMGNLGYRHTSAVLAPNEHGCNVMYLFFTLYAKTDSEEIT